MRRVLVLAEHDDATTDLVADAVRARGGDVVRLDTADYPAAVSVTARPDDPRAGGCLTVHGRDIALDSIRSVYRRRCARFTFPAALSRPERRFATFETLHGLAGILAAQDWRWIDRPERVADAANKTHQLPVAARCGLRVPKTLVTDDPARARRFLADVGEAVYKTLSGAVVTEGDELKLIYTTRVTVADVDDAAVRQCLHQFQAWVPKSHDVRLTAVGDRCFAVAVHAGSPEAVVDWRSRYGDLTYHVCPVPADVRDGVLGYLRTFGLTFGAFDFSVDPAGRWWMLECNPAGQWGWLVDETGIPVADALADLLVSAA